MARSTSFLLLCSAFLLASCGSDQGPIIPPHAATLEISAGNTQSARPGAAVPVSPTVRVLDSAGAPIAGIPVTFAVLAGGGSVGTGTVATGADGKAAAAWTLGAATGVQRLAATVTGLPAVTFLAYAAGQSSADIAPFNVDYPDPNDFWGDTADVRIHTTSTFALDSVAAVVGGVRRRLTLTPNGWTARLPLLTEPYGATFMVISAWDINGSRRDSAIGIFHDGVPRIVVATPAPGEVVSPPSFAIRAACVDDNPGGCTFLQVRYGIDSILATGTDSVTVTFPVANRLGQVLSFLFVVRDDRGRQVTLTQTVYVADPARLTLLHAYEGQVLDAFDDRALHRGAGGDLRLTIGSAPAVVLAPSFTLPMLTDSGAIWATTGANAHLFEFHRGTSTDLGKILASASALATRGSFLARTFRDTVITCPGGICTTRITDMLVRRDLATGAEVTADSGVLRGIDVAASGDVVYGLGASLTQVRRYRNGVITTMSRDGSVPNDDPRTDGTLVVYRRRSVNDQQKGIILEDGVSETALAPVVARSSVTVDQDYQVNSGWVAFTRINAGDGSTQVWRRSPAGALDLVGPFSGTGRIEAVGDDGTVFFTRNSHRYVVRGSSTTATDLGDANGRLIWRRGVFLLLVAERVYRVTP